MKARLSDDVVMPMTIVNPPPVQEMKSGAENRDVPPHSGNDVPPSGNDVEQQTNLEMVAL